MITFLAPVSSPACSATKRTDSVDMVTGGVVLALTACTVAVLTECVLGALWKNPLFTHFFTTTKKKKVEGGKKVEERKREERLIASNKLLVPGWTRGKTNGSKCLVHFELSSLICPTDFKLTKMSTNAQNLSSKHLTSTSRGYLDDSGVPTSLQCSLKDSALWPFHTWRCLYSCRKCCCSFLQKCNLDTLNTSWKDMAYLTLFSKTVKQYFHIFQLN